MIRAKHNIRHSGVLYTKGTILEGLKPDEEKRLVLLKSAEYVITPEEELRKQQIEADKVIVPPEEFEELRAALDEEYNAEELVREAKAVGVDLTGTSTKKSVIEAIINQGKADELLEDDDSE